MKLIQTFSTHRFRWPTAAVAAAATQLLGQAALAQSPFSTPTEALFSTGLTDSDVVADFNGDGLPDVLKTVPGIGFLYLYVGQGGGDFSLRGNVLPPGSSGSTSSNAVGDLDGDGDLDLIVTGFLDSPLRKLVNDGAGNFTVEALGLSGGPWRSARFLDVNSDGSDDLVVWGAQSNGLALHWIDGQGGTFTSAPQFFFSVPDSSFRAVDVDGDGNQDFYSRAPNGGLRVAFGQGGVAFAPFVPLSGAGAQAVFPLTLRDINGDGNVEIFAFRPNGLRYFRATGPRTYAPPVLLTSSLEQGNSSQFLDVDGDGDLDVLHLTSESFSYASQATTDTLTFLQSAPGVFTQGPPTGAAVENFANVKDLDGDGLGDLVAAGVDGLQWQKGGDGAGMAYFGPLRRVAPGTLNPSFHALADLDQDGNVDVVVTSREERLVGWMENTGGGTYADPVVLDSPTATPEQTEAIDFDGDGDQDLVLLRSVDGAIHEVAVLLNDGAGSFSSLGQPFRFPANLVRQLDVLDVDADGTLDLVVLRGLGFGGSGPVLYLGDGVGGFTLAAAPFANQRLNGLAIGDLNADGLPDLVGLTPFVPPTGQSLAIALNLGGGGFTPASLQSLPLSFSGLNVVDLNQDGNDDVVLSGLQVTLFAGDGMGSVQPGVSLGATGLLQVEFVDLDLDGDLDIVSRDGSTSRAKEWSEQVAGGTFVPKSNLFDSGGRVGERVQFADMNGDGDLDAVALNPNVDSGFNFRIYENDTLSEIGQSFCDAQGANSSGVPGVLSAFGSEDVGMNSVQLIASALPANQFGLFVGSRTFGAGMPIAGSMGLLCLTGGIGRYQGPGQIQSSGSEGAVTLDLDLGALSLPNGSVAGMPGESWSFQTWHRDVINGAATSHLTRGIVITLR